jgi:protoporphyrinogen oxidase
MMQYGINELCTSRRDKSLEDESIWSFIERRFDAQIADNMVDPIFKGFKKIFVILRGEYKIL